ncbi:tRNA dihydrouridine synthase DusB [Thalassotalea sp. HSM 43]|uniref:tRNA dihydrouridine synthase DusB n=1 Tax=unclassified Thalassotalea TaxID=2614972 RepID=UPI00107FEB73|nr:tRNA dihydrouridine synthase DusB [Thalassotalea sp. HSM 43]NMP17078.1 tRNA dihydrouridine synthase DusB [Thalassotalea sp. Y01]QBY04714.1 tRNA dihydrouridine synthase DusB [Thalassotalea sp. HSM 43]
MNIGPYQLDSNVILAPMAGITDKPFRQLCCRLGAGMAVGEMLSSNPQVWKSGKSMKRMEHSDEAGIRSVQIAGSEPNDMAFAAKYNAENGAQIIDINMGCPAKKVNKKLAGSALLKAPEQVEQIVKAVVNAVDIPVTLKIRTGWCENSRNGVEIAKIAELNGIQALAVHGRTRCDFYKGEAEYDTIKAIKQAIDIPVIANGDITGPDKAKQVLEYTGADAVMIGRAAQGRPWIFREINHYLATGDYLPAAAIEEVRNILLSHVAELHNFYGEFMGTRIARKHVSWYLQTHDQGKQFRSTFNALELPEQQLTALNVFFDNLTN